MNKIHVPTVAYNSENSTETKRSFRVNIPESSIQLPSLGFKRIGFLRSKKLIAVRRTRLITVAIGEPVTALLFCVIRNCVFA